MAFESNTLKVAHKNKLPKSEFFVECNIKTEEEISKILTVSSQVIVTGKEVLDGKVEYSGTVECSLIYLSANNEISSVASSCGFTSKFEDENIKPEQKAVVRVCVCENDIVGISGSDVMVKFTLCQTGFTIGNNEIKAISSSNNDIATAEEMMKVYRYVGEGRSSFCSETPFISREPIKKLLLTESQLQIKSVESGVNFVTISGEIVNKVLFLTENDRFESAYIFESFKQELEIDGVTRDSIVEGGGFIKFNEARAEVENNDKESKIMVFVPVELFAFAFAKEDVLVVRDLYSTKNELEIITESFEMSNCLPFELLEGKIDGTLIIEDDKPRVDKILFSGADSVLITNSYIEDDKIKVEGIAKTNVVYLNDDTNTINAVNLEVPFVLEDRTDVLETASTVAVGIVCDSDVVVKKGRELCYDAKVKVLVYIDNCEQEAVISNISIKDELPQSDYSMQILFAKEGQTSWDIGKINKINEEIIKYQNPEVVFPLQKDCELIVFYQINR